jgi:SAM-dependent methyltransferase
VKSVSSGVPSDAYAGLADHYHLIFADWHESMRRQSAALDGVVRAELGRGQLSVLDASCGIGTQAIGLAQLGYRVHGTDLSPPAVERARREAAALCVTATFGVADMRALETEVDGAFDVVLSADNAVAHLPTEDDLALAARAMRAKLRDGGLLLVTVRAYDALLREKPRTSTPAVFDRPEGRRVVFHVFDWEPEGNAYRTNLFILRETGGGWATLHWAARFRAWRRAELDHALAGAGFGEARWWTPEESGFFQPLVTARRF